MRASVVRHLVLAIARPNSAPKSLADLAGMSLSMRKKRVELYICFRKHGLHNSLCNMHVTNVREQWYYLTSKYLYV